MSSYIVGTYESMSTNPYIINVGETWYKFPIEPTQGFPQAFPVSIKGIYYNVYLYIVQTEWETYMILRIDSPDGIVFNRKITEKVRIYVNEDFDLYFQQITINTDNPNRSGQIGNYVLGGVYIRESS